MSHGASPSFLMIAAVISMYSGTPQGSGGGSALPSRPWPGKSSAATRMPVESRSATLPIIFAEQPQPCRSSAERSPLPLMTRSTFAPQTSSCIVPLTTPFLPTVLDSPIILHFLSE